MDKIYLDAIELAEKEIFGVVLDEDQKIILAGTTIYSMDVGLKKEYKQYADQYNLHFIFEDELPNIDFYTVPQVDIMAIDNLGGFIGTIGGQSDIESDSPICYINKELECFLIAENGQEFLQNIESWKNNLKPYDEVIFYRSKADAKKELTFTSLPRVCFCKNI